MSIKLNKLALNQEKWIEQLLLKYNWEDKCSSVICLIVALATLSEQMENGYFIIKQVFIISSYPSLEKDIIIEADIKKNKRVMDMDYLICESKVSDDKEVLIEMRTTLIRKSQQEVKAIKKFQGKAEFFRIIKEEDVIKFCELSKDPNYIHKGKNPIVQGMFLFLLIEDYLADKSRFIKKGEIIYFVPIKTECSLFFSWESSNILSGIVNNTKCFTLTIEEDFS